MLDTQRVKDVVPLFLHEVLPFSKLLGALAGYFVAEGELHGAIYG